MAISQNGTHVVFGSWDNTARIWNVRTRGPVGLPLRHEGVVNAVAFSPDGNTVLTGSADHSARLWDSATGKPIGRPLLHDGPVTSVAFGADGRTILTGSTDRTVRIWEFHSRPVEGDVQRIELWVEVITGLSLDGKGTVHFLDAEAWNKRRARWRAGAHNVGTRS